MRDAWTGFGWDGETLWGTGVIRTGGPIQIETVRTYVIENPPPRRGGHYWTLLKLVTDEGTEGLGEAYGVPFNPDVTAHVMRDIGERHVIGKQPFEIERIWREIYLGSADTHSPHHPDLIQLNGHLRLMVLKRMLSGSLIWQKNRYFDSSPFFAFCTHSS